MASKILVIDDDPAVRSAFKLILEDDKFSVREAENGLQGVEMTSRRTARSDFSGSAHARHRWRGNLAPSESH